MAASRTNAFTIQRPLDLAFGEVTSGFAGSQPTAGGVSEKLMEILTNVSMTFLHSSIQQWFLGFVQEIQGSRNLKAR